MYHLHFLIFLGCPAHHDSCPVCDHILPGSVAEWPQLMSSLALPGIPTLDGNMEPCQLNHMIDHWPSHVQIAHIDYILHHGWMPWKKLETSRAGCSLIPRRRTFPFTTLQQLLRSGCQIRHVWWQSRTIRVLVLWAGWQMVKGWLGILVTTWRVCWKKSLLLELYSISFVQSILACLDEAPHRSCSYFGFAPLPPPHSS